MCYEPGAKEKLLAEIDPLMDSVKDDIMGKMTLESIEDLEYTKMCYQETMRRDAPAVISSTSCLSKDALIDGVRVNAGEAFWVGISYI